MSTKKPAWETTRETAKQALPARVAWRSGMDVYPYCYKTVIEKHPSTSYRIPRPSSCSIAKNYFS
jgi:hypothetical protein